LRPNTGTWKSLTKDAFDAPQMGRVSARFCGHEIFQVSYWTAAAYFVPCGNSFRRKAISSQEKKPRFLEEFLEYALEIRMHTRDSNA
jgi:hypothetical protein